jgi:flavoprotein
VTFDANSQWWKTISKRSTACGTCSRSLPRGAVIVYRARPKSVRCLACSSDQALAPLTSKSYMAARERAGAS